MKYPKQVAAVNTASQTLAVDASLCVPQEAELDADKKSPLYMHSGMSVFNISLLDWKKEGKPVYVANIPAREIKYIQQKTLIAFAELQKKLQPKSEELLAVKKLNDQLNDCFLWLFNKLKGLITGTSAKTKSNQRKTQQTPQKDYSPAYNVTLMDNRFKGKTPASVLIEDSSKRESLLGCIPFLERNLSRYPNNAKQIEAINLAVELLDTGKLDEQKQESNGYCFEIYSADYKFKNQKNEQGMNKIYNIHITCDTNKKYPICISITNCWAHVSRDNGRAQVQMSNALDIKTGSINLSEMDWGCMINQMASTVENFETMYFRTQFKQMLDNSYKHQS